MAFDKVKYDNQYAKNNYDRIPINVPKGKKAEIESHAKMRGYKSVTAYVVDLIERDMQTATVSDVVEISLDLDATRKVISESTKLVGKKRVKVDNGVTAQ